MARVLPNASLGAIDVKKNPQKINITLCSSTEEAEEAMFFESLFLNALQLRQKNLKVPKKAEPKVQEVKK